MKNFKKLSKEKKGKNKKIDKSPGSGTDKELISEIAKKLDINPVQAKYHIKVIVECITRCLDENGFINIRKLGRFEIRKRKYAKIKNFQGQMVKIPLMFSVGFKSSYSLKKLVNRKAVELRDEAKK